MEGYLFIIKAPIGRFSSQLHTHVFGRLAKRSGKEERDYRAGVMDKQYFFKLAKGVYFLTVNPEPCPNPYYTLIKSEMDIITSDMQTGKEYWEAFSKSKGYQVRW